MTEKLLPIVLSLATDKVPNVRFNVAKTLGCIHSKIAAESIESKVAPLLQGLVEDSDTDVRNYAEEALKRIRGESAIEEC